MDNHNRFMFPKRGNFINSMLILSRGGDKNEARDITYIGKDGKSLYVVQYSGKKDPENQIKITEVCEITNYVFRYPYIYFVKGGIHLYIYNMYEPNKAIYLDFEEQGQTFVSFVHESSNKNSGIQFLTERNVDKQEAANNRKFNRQCINVKEYKSSVNSGNYIFLNRIS